MFKYLRIGFGLLVTLMVFTINWKLYDYPDDAVLLKSEIVHQLNFLENSLKKENAADRMQALYPEGEVFIYALYGLSWSQLAGALPDTDSIRQRSLSEGLYAYQQINSTHAQRIFHSELNPDFGIFYAGWRNYLLVNLLKAHRQFEGRNQLVLQFENQCDEIAASLQDSSVPFLESYNGLRWPADMVVAMAALSIHDQLFRPKYQLLIDKWKAQVKSHLVPESQLIAHQFFTQEGAVSSVRGSSSALIVRLFADIDPAFGAQLYEHMKVQFADQVLGLPALREYPHGTFGLGDVDSGPVVLGVGFAGTLVSVGTFATYGDWSLAMQQQRTIHAFGFARKNHTEASYLLGLLPMADAFIVWSKTAMFAHFDARSPHHRLPVPLSFHLYSAAVLFMVWLILFFRRCIAFLVRSRQNV